LRVVVVEDNEDVGATLLEWLEQRGHRVWAARSGDAGVGLVQEVHPDLVLCDLGLPGMDGIEVCRRVRALPLERQPQMVALTGWGREGDRDRTRQVGFDDHLVKPVAGEELEGVLSRVSNGRS
jgi:CheY-like chemotaxis protein